MESKELQEQALKEARTTFLQHSSAWLDKIATAVGEPLTEEQHHSIALVLSEAFICGAEFGGKPVQEYFEQTKTN